MLFLRLSSTTVLKETTLFMMGKFLGTVKIISCRIYIKFSDRHTCISIFLEASARITLSPFQLCNSTIAYTIFVQTCDGLKSHFCPSSFPYVG